MCPQRRSAALTRSEIVKRSSRLGSSARAITHFSPSAMRYVAEGAGGSESDDADTVDEA